MKTSKFLVSALLSGVLLVSSVYGTESDKSKNTSTDAKNVVREQIVDALSDITAPNNQEVYVHFSVSSDKGFELLKVDGANSELAKEVKSKLISENIKVTSELEGAYVIKVRFADKAEVKPELASDVLRKNIATALSSVEASDASSVKLTLTVKNDNVIVEKVEGSDKKVVSSVENVLAKNAIYSPAELAGTYQVTVKF